MGFQPYSPWPTQPNKTEGAMSKLLIPEYPLQLLPSLAEKIGLNEALLVQQIHYWLKTSSIERDGRKWIFNSYKEWRKQFPFWSVSTIGRIVRSLEEKKIIITKQFEVSGYDRRKWYTLNYQNGIFEDVKMVSSSVPDGNDLHIEEINPETKTEITTVIELMLQEWKVLFPNKPQPRSSTKTIREKVKARWKETWFREHWKEAMTRASQSPTLQKESWFDFRYFIRNEDNAEKCYDRFMAWKDEQLPPQLPVNQPGMTPEKWKTLKEAQNKVGISTKEIAEIEKKRKEDMDAQKKS